MKISTSATNSYLKLSLSLFSLVKDYSFCGEEFVIRVNYDKIQFEHLKQEHIRKILEELKKSKLYRYCWAVHRPLCEDVEVPGNYFLCSAVITTTRE